MLLVIAIITIILAVLFMILGVVWRSMMLTGLDIILWLLNGLFICQVEIPYQTLDATGTIVTSTHVIESMHMLAPLFYGIAFLMFFFLAVEYAFPMLQGRFNRMM